VIRWCEVNLHWPRLACLLFLCYGRAIALGRPIYFVAVVYIFVFLLLFFLAYSQRSQIGCLLYFHTWCGLSANLECRSEMCGARLAENTGRKNRQKSPSTHHRTNLSSYMFATKACIDNQEKNLLHSNISSIRAHNMVNFGTLTSEISWRVWGTPTNFNGFRLLASLRHRRRSTEVNQTSHDVWPFPGLVYYIFGGSFS